MLIRGVDFRNTLFGVGCIRLSMVIHTQHRTRPLPNRVGVFDVKWLGLINLSAEINSCRYSHSHCHDRNQPFVKLMFSDAYVVAFYEKWLDLINL